MICSRIGNCEKVEKRKKGGIIEEERKEDAKKRRCPLKHLFSYNNDVLTHTPYADGVGDCVFVRTSGGELFVAYHKHTSVGNEGASRSVCIDRAYFVPAENEGDPDVLCVFGPTGTKQPKPR